MAANRQTDNETPGQENLSRGRRRSLSQMEAESSEPTEARGSSAGSAVKRQKLEMTPRDHVPSVDSVWRHIAHCKSCAYIRHHIRRLDVPWLPETRAPQLCSAQSRRRLEMKWHNNTEMLNPAHMQAGILAICAALDIAACTPTIDCFASYDNAQPATSMYITRRQDFFSQRFECRSFWKVSVAWAHPPRFVEELKRTIRSFRHRRMRGFVCGPEWNGWLVFARCQLGYRGEKNVAGRRSQSIYRSQEYGYRAKCGSSCDFDTVIVYFDFSGRL